MKADSESLNLRRRWIIEIDYLRLTNQLDTEAIDGTSGQALRRGVVVTGVDDAVKVGAFFLDRFDGAPEDSLASASVVRVRVEESHGSFPVSSCIYYVPS